ncbi:Uncharacterised protein [Serratia plymuthica]|nr:Uncharacterised protein [Serratia plymuthica]
MMGVLALAIVGSLLLDFTMGHPGSLCLPCGKR